MYSISLRFVASFCRAQNTCSNDKWRRRSLYRRNAHSSRPRAAPRYAWSIPNRAGLTPITSSSSVSSKLNLSDCSSHVQRKSLHKPPARVQTASAKSHRRPVRDAFQITADPSSITPFFSGSRDSLSGHQRQALRMHQPREHPATLVQQQPLYCQNAIFRKLKKL